MDLDLHFAYVLLACALCCGCGGIGSGSGDDAPVGLMLEGSDGVPAVEIAALARPGGMDDGSVQSLAGALHGALRRCGSEARGAALASELQQGMSLRFSLEQGRLVTAPSMTDAGACLARALAGANLSGLSASRSLSLELRTPRGSRAIAATGSATVAR